MKPFAERLTVAVQDKGPVCIGLDPHLHLLPQHFRERYAGLGGPAFRLAAAGAVLDWGLEVLEAIEGVAAAIKPQVAFFEQLGAPGIGALEALVARAKAMDLLVVLDAKRGDIGSTAQGYCRATLDDTGPLGADSVTLSPYLGPESLRPFLDCCDAQGKGLFILVRTSNAEADAMQANGVAEKVAGWISGWNQIRSTPPNLGPVGAVVGATVPAEASFLRSAMPQSWILVPGYGAQGGSAADTLPCFREDGLGALVNSSRGVLFAKAGEEARYQADHQAVVQAHGQAMAAELKALHP
ncbi:MAG: orotidine-5'-phosphate decarboxylase [Cognaticolwellia sp.]|jgi:orotidine-5'-phosphate decarboxylase